MPRDGTIIGDRYELTGKLGEGGMGAVYRAIDGHSGRTVALKLVHSDIAQDPVQMDRFRREFQVLKDLSHPSLVRLLDGSFDGEEPYLVFDLVDGQSLEAEIAGRALPIAKALSYAEQLAEAVGVLHVAKIIHRDLKPSNVMVRPGGQICLLDFGIAKHYGDAQRTLDRVTREGYVVGTPQYMPPEALFGGDISPAYDVWSIGVMLYEMLTGRRPFASVEESVTDLAAALARGRFEPPSRVRAELPRAMDATLERFLEVKPADRPANGAEAAQAIAELGRITTTVLDPSTNPGTVQVEQVAHLAGPGTAVGPRPSRKARTQAVEPQARDVAMASQAGRKRISAPVPAPALRVGTLAAFGALALVVAGLALRPAPQPSPTPIATATATPSASSAAPDDRSADRAKLRGYLFELKRIVPPQNLGAWIAEAVSTPFDDATTPDKRASAGVKTRLALKKLGALDALVGLLGGTVDPAKLLDRPDERRAWLEVGWLAIVEHALDEARGAKLYPRSLAKQVDLAWQPAPRVPVTRWWYSAIMRTILADDSDTRLELPAGVASWKSLTMTYDFDVSARPTVARLWFGASNLNSHHALVARVNNNPPVVLRAAGRPLVPVLFLPRNVTYGKGGGDTIDGTFCALLGVDDSERVYVGRDIPADWLEAGHNQLQVEAINLRFPLQHAYEQTPPIWLKVVSYKIP